MRCAPSDAAVRAGQTMAVRIRVLFIGCDDGWAKGAAIGRVRLIVLSDEDHLLVPLANAFTQDPGVMMDRTFANEPVAGLTLAELAEKYFTTVAKAFAGSGDSLAQSHSSCTRRNMTLRPL